MAFLDHKALLLALTAYGLLQNSVSAQVGGIRIDTEGLLHQAAVTDSTKPIPDAPREIARRHKTRKISLKRLEATIIEHLDARRPLPVEVRYLAGLRRIDEVLLAEDGDVVLVGPAGGWTRLASGEVADPDSRHPVLELDDLAIALRFATATRESDSFIGCSIDPTREGIKSYSRYLKRLSGPINPKRIPSLLTGMQKAMGLQVVRVFGVPADSRFACKLVAADYRLKRVAMGFERPPVKGLLNYIDLLAKSNKAAVRHQHRFWFVATHQGISHSGDFRTWRFTGPGLAVRTAAAGTSNERNKATPLARKMASNLTNHFPQLSQHIPIFGELENLVRLALAAEIAVHAPLADSASRWRSHVLVDAARYQAGTTPAPRHVPSFASIRKARGRNWIMSVSGGVKLEPPPVRLRNFGTVDRRLASRISAVRKGTAADAWWWD